jgi:tRNA-uridine 2-sulfurtransferase
VVLEERPLTRKAVALLSGGLDSALAIYLVKRQGIEITALHFPSFFSPLDPESEDAPVKLLARQLDVPLVLQPKGNDFIDIIRNPRYGHGKNLNPCIDCRIYSFIKAREFMESIGASFIVTGEVAGQRPMSQRRETMKLIEKRAGCAGIVLRPLSAHALAPTRPEEAGVVDRTQLLSVTGRGRKTQLHMAEELGLYGYSPPAGGCLLTDRGFSERVRDLLAEKDEVNEEELNLLRVGRHIRVRPGLKIIVGRNQSDNQRLEELSRGSVVFHPVDFPGPVVLADGCPDPEEDLLIAGVVSRYARESSRGEWVEARCPTGGARRIRVRHLTGNDWIQEHLL